MALMQFLIKSEVKMKKIFKRIGYIIAIFLVIFTLFTTLIIVNKDFRLWATKSAYSVNPSSESLVNLCNSLLYTNHESEKIKYFSLLLDNPSNYNAIENIVSKHSIAQNKIGIEDATQAYDTFLVEYLNSFLKLHEFDLFKETFAKKFHKSRTIGYKYDYWETLIQDPDINGQLDALLTTLKADYMILNENYSEKLGNLSFQYSIYSLQGNNAKALEAQKYMQEILDILHKKNTK
jgi:hypothetical protein